MSSLSAKDRVSLCSFTFSDGRRCCTPRFANHPRLCPYHAQKEARARAAQKLGKDLAYFFSGDYLSACDLSSALGRLIPAVLRGDVKLRTARTVAYLVQTLMQAIHISQHEYINAFGTDGWRKSIRNSVNGNHDYLFPPAPKSDPDPEPQQSASPQPQPAAVAHPGMHPDPVGRGEAVSSSPAHPPTQPQQPAPLPHTPLPPTSAEFVQHVLLAGLVHPEPRGEPGSLPATPHVQAAPPNRQPAETPVNCHSEHSEESAFSESPSPTSAHAPQALAAHTAPSSPACHPERSEGSHPIPAPQPARSVSPAPQVGNSLQTGSHTPQPAPNRAAHALHFDHSCRLLIDGKPF